MAGGGGGFVMAPYWLAIGLTPAQGAAAGSFMATGMSTSSVAVFRGTDHFPKSKRMLYLLSATALLGSALGAFVLPKIEVETFQYVLAVVTIGALPLLFFKPKGRYDLSKHRNFGLVLAISLLIIGSIITSSAFSILFSLTLTTFFDLSVLRVTAIRRLVGIVQSVVLFVALTLQGYFVWQHALAGFIGGSIGSYLGTKYAVKRGESFAKYALAAMSLLSAIAVLL